MKKKTVLLLSLTASINVFALPYHGNIKNNLSIPLKVSASVCDICSTDVCQPLTQLNSPIRKNASREIDGNTSQLCSIGTYIKITQVKSTDDSFIVNYHGTCDNHSTNNFILSPVYDQNKKIIDIECAMS